MRRIASIGVAAAVLAAALTVAPARASTKQSGTMKNPCVVAALLPSVMDQGEGASASSIVDIIVVSCAPRFAEEYVTIYSSELYSACANGLFWVGQTQNSGPSTTAQLDDNGNAAVLVFGGPSCAPTTVDIFASMESPPYATVQTTLKILPPRSEDPPAKLAAAPASYVEDGVSTPVAQTVLQLNFPTADNGAMVSLSSQALYDRCTSGEWLGPEATVLASDTATVNVKLDGDGNAFAVYVGDGCASGSSTIDGNLTIAPHTMLTTSFDILPPQVEHR